MLGISMRASILLVALLWSSVGSFAQEPGTEPESFEQAAPRLYKEYPFFERLMTSPATDDERALQHTLQQHGLLPRYWRPYQIHELKGPERKVSVFVRRVAVWPGNNTEVIAITDLNDRLLAWKEVGGEPIFLAVDFAWNPKRPILEIARAHRPRFDRSIGVYRYSLKDDKIKLLPPR
jgi:hypothetical protein